MSFSLLARSLVGIVLAVATATSASAQLPRVIPPSIASPKSPPPRFVPNPKMAPKGSLRSPTGSLPKNWFSGTPKSAYKLPVTPRLRTPSVKGPSSSNKGSKPSQFFELSFGKPKPPEPSPIKPKPVKPQQDPPGPIQPVRPVGPVRPIGK